ncbi:MAG: DUF1214 domain-containing protein [Acidimicrobiales bacterium]
MPDNPIPQAAAALDDLIAALTEIRDGYVLDAARWIEPLEQVESIRYVGQMLAAMSALYWEAQPEHPRFVSIVDPGRKLQGDNPDAIYHYARIDGSRKYRVTGHITDECYTSFTLHGRADDGGMAGPLLGDINDRALTVDAEGRYSLTISADQADADGGDWIELDPGTIAVIVRGYFQLPVSAQNDSEVHVDIDIECLDVDTPPPSLTDGFLAERMNEGLAFLRQVTTRQGRFGESGVGVPFASTEPNVLPKPFSFRDSGLPVPGAADIHYAMCRWDLGPDEALVMRGTIPPGVFVNVMLWNAHMQTLEYRGRQSSLNGVQIQLEDDGTFEIWVSAKDPGHPNWLDTDAHRRGTVFWRFLLPDEDPEQPTSEVVTLG